MKRQKPKPAAFMSYAHKDDKYEHVTRFYERLSTKWAFTSEKNF